MSTKKYLDDNGLLYFWQKIKNAFVAKDGSKVLSDNNYTDAEKAKLAALDANGEENVIEIVKVNGAALTPDASKAVDVTVPTKTSDLTNDDNVVKDANYTHTDNNYSTSEKNKLNGISAGAEVNAIDTVKVNGVEQTITNKAIDIDVPTKTSDLTNDSNFAVDASYVHTDNNYTTSEKNKLSGIASGAQVNVIEEIEVNGTSATISGKKASVTIEAGAIDSISVNGTAQTIDANKNVDITVPTNNNQLTNGAGYQTASDVSTAIDAAISSTYKAAGSVTFANLPSAVKANEGKVYNVSDSFTTTSSFVEGAGNTYPAGTNVVIINTSGSTYKYDVLSGFVDLSGYVQDSDLVAITNGEIDTIVAS